MKNEKWIFQKIEIKSTRFCLMLGCILVERVHAYNLEISWIAE